jgi:hypothetical protein
MRKLGLFPLAALAFAACDDCGEIAAIPQPEAVLVHGEDEAPPLPHLEVPVAPALIGSQSGVTVTLKNIGFARLEVDDVRFTSDPELCPNPAAAFSMLTAAPSEVAAESEVDISISFEPTSAVPVCTVLSVQTSDERNPELKAVLVGQGDAPALCASTDLIDFGEVLLGDRAEDTATLTSCGTRPITITALTLNEQFPPFDADLPTLPLTLQPDEALDLPVAFEPTVEGTWSRAAGTQGSINIETDALGQLYQVDLVATARRPPSCVLGAIPTLLNFGTVAEGRTSTQPVVLRNYGELDCNVSGIALRDGVASFSITPPATPLTILPGDTVLFDATFAPLAAVGTENDAILVDSDDPANAQLEIPLEGNSIEPTPCLLEASPTGVNFGNQAMGQTVSREVVLTNVGTELCSLRDVDLQSGSPHFSVVSSVFPFIGTPVPVGGSISVIVNYRPATDGLHTGVLRFGYKEFGFGNPDVNLDVPLSGSGVPPRVCVVPVALDFGTLAPGDVANLPVSVQNCGAVDLNVRGLQMRAASHPGFSVAAGAGLPLILAPGASLDLTATAAPTDTGPMYGTIEVLTTDAQIPAFPVPVRANAEACQQGLVCTPDTLVFGDVDLGTTLVRSLACQNPGATPVDVNPTITGDFTLLSGPAQVAPQGTAMFVVEYTPSATGPATGNLDLGVNDCEGAPLVAGLEGNGVEDELPVCPTPEAFSPEVVWHWEGGSVQPNSNMVWTTPLVSRLEDTDGDGVVTRDDTPRVIFISFDHDDNQAVISPDDQDHINDPTPGILRVLDGATGAEVFTNTEHLLNSSVTPVVADIDADGFPEIVAQKWIVLEGVEDIPDGPKIKGKFVRGNLMAFEHDGTFKWESEEWTRSQDEIEDSGALAVADIDGDGFGEIAVGDHVFQHTGELRFAGGKGTGSTGHGPISAFADLDGQPGLELVAGRTAYRQDGSILWDRSDLNTEFGGETFVFDAHPAIADLDGDGQNEVVLRGGDLYVLNGRTGATLAGPLNPPTDMAMGDECDAGELEEGEEDPCNPIPTHPVILDVDGGGDLEIAIGNTNVLLVYKFTGSGFSELWRVPVSDQTGASGPIGFDFEDDGLQSVVYNDEGHVYVYDDRGNVIYDASRASVTLAETTAVADINNDGHANLVIGSNEPFIGLADGLDMLSNTGTSWPHARSIWNQHPYVEGLVGELGTLLFHPGGMPALNGFRTATAQCR